MQDGCDKALVAVYPKHVIVRLNHFCQLAFVANGRVRPHMYATVLVFARYNPESENVTIGVFVTKRERQEEVSSGSKKVWAIIVTMVQTCRIYMLKLHPQLINLSQNRFIDVQNM